MKSRLELRLSGSGGQGVILASIILAQAALMEGKRVMQSQSYGPEARGGMCRAEVIIDSAEIDFQKVQVPDFLLALTRQSFEKYAPGVSRRGVIMMDADLTPERPLPGVRIVRVPILRTAREVIGKPITANIVAVGAINSLLGIASERNLRKAVLLHVPASTRDINLPALEKGSGLVSELQGPLKVTA